MFKTVLIFFCLVCLFPHHRCLEVSIIHGKLFGHELHSRNGTKFYGFYNIPYAKPPVGNLRFEPPQEPDFWNDVRNESVHNPKICVQRNVFWNFNKNLTSFRGDEDCLYLNVFTPEINPTEKLPVMVWIHGGAYKMGAAAEHPPYYLMDHRIVYVSINYRLGPFGFFSTLDNIVPGNNGFKDQVAALHWVQNNIGSFGGDPKQVTIAGESAGGSSVALHLYSSLSTGLFHRAIAQSGSALAMWTFHSKQRAKDFTNAYAVLAGCPLSSKQLVTCLRDIPAEELITIQEKFRELIFVAVEESSNGTNYFLTKSPRSSEVVNNVPLLIGFTSDEGGIFLAKELAENKKKLSDLNSYKRSFPVMFAYGSMVDEKQKDELSESIKQYYFGNETIGMDKKTALINLYSDAFFTSHIIEEALRQKNDTYFYVYDHQNVQNVMGELFKDVKEDFGVGHGSDLTSLFPMKYGGMKAATGDDKIVSERMVQHWVNFIAKGNPNDGDLSWPPIKSPKLPYLQIRKEETVNEDLLSEKNFEGRYKLWSAVYQKKEFNGL